MLDGRIAVVTANFKQPFKKALHTAAGLGARGVQIDALNELRPGELSQTGVRQFRKMLDDLNLRVASVRFPTRRGYYDLDRLDERVAATKRAMQLAYDLGTRVVINQIGRVPEDETSPEWQTLIEVMTDLGNHGHRAGAVLAAKTGSESAADLERLLNALPEGAIGVDLDPGRLIINGFSASEALQTLASRVVHVTATDGVRDLAIGRGLEVQLGRGSVDFPELVAVLEERNYRGWFTIERRDAADPVHEIGESMEFLRNLYT